MLVADTLVAIGLSAISLGTIHETDGQQEHVFWLRNAGSEAVVLRQGYTSCGCTTIDFAQGATLRPDDSTAVTLRFNPRGKGGAFHETATLVYGEQRKRITLTMTGSCITSEETLLRQFPVRVNDSLRLSVDRFDLGIMHPGESKQRSVVLLNRADNDRQQRFTIVFHADEHMPRGLQHIAWPLKADGLTLTIMLDVIVR
ncbi:MAG: DUF1573 domain-containing protein [Prevotella sp.]|nr:DUF1573 domain-containing protein [Prevotella sp.]